MQLREEKLKAIIDWSENNKDISAVLLTSSLVNPMAPVDEFSDLDIELVFENNDKYISDNRWIKHFGDPLAMIEEDKNCFNGKYAMKMVMYKDGVKVDFKLYSKKEFEKEVQQDELCEDWDIGYKILIDKEEITTKMQKPTYRVSIIKKPSAEKVRQVLNDFWFDTTYVAKCLARQDLFYAKYMSENIIRTEYLIPLLEWHIASQHEWKITTNKFGRLFKKYLSADIWQLADQTFSGSEIEENWKALFAMSDLVSQIGKELSGKSGFEYPKKLESDIRDYLNRVKKGSL